MFASRGRMWMVAGFLGFTTSAWAQSSAGAGAIAADATDGRQDFSGRKVVLITGSTDGLGREAAIRLAATGAHVIVHGRNLERGAEVVAEIRKNGKGSARFYPADFASLEAVRNFAAEIRRDHTRLDVLVNNAGIWLTGNVRQTSADGHELHFAVNYLSAFLLTRSLLPLLVHDSEARIVNVASTAQTPIDFADVMLLNGYSNSRGYGQSKLALVHFGFDLARELAGTRVIVNSLHPATLMATGMVVDRGMAPRATVEEGVTALLNLVQSPGLESGLYFNGLRPARANAQAYDETARQKLRELSAALTGTK